MLINMLFILKKKKNKTNQNNIRHCFFVKNLKKKEIVDDVCFDTYMTTQSGQRGLAKKVTNAFFILPF